MKDAWSIKQGYDVTRMDMEALEGVISAAGYMQKALAGDGKYTIQGALINLTAESARLLGLPVANVKRDVLSVISTAAIESDNYLMQYRLDKFLMSVTNSGNRKNYMDILYNASLNDREAYEIIYADMIKSGIEDSAIRSGMEDRMKAAQGVKSVKDLDSRYLTPDEEKEYNTLRKSVGASPAWKSATAKQREGVEDDLYNLVVGNDAGVKLSEKIDAGTAYGVNTLKYLLFELAMEMADEKNEDSAKRNNSFDQAEVEAAINSLSGLSDSAKAYLWNSRGWNPENNPYD